MQKQPPEVFRRKWFSKKFRKYHRKKPVFECLFIKVSKNFAKKRLPHRCFPVEFAKFFRKPTFEEHLPKTASIFEIGSCSMLVSDIIFCIILQWTKKELML